MSKVCSPILVSPVAPSLQLDDARTSRPRRVLYADDVRQLRDIVSLILAREGFEVETVEDGALAWERLQQGGAQYDVLITDHHMPRLNGLDLVTRLREQGYAGKIAVFSSELSHRVQADYRALQVDAILQKPILPQALRSLIRDLSEAPRAAGQAR